MQESTGADKKREEPGVGAESDATSKETLSDVEKNEDTGSKSSKVDPGPAPDGTFDESDENKHAEPV